MRSAQRSLCLWVIVSALVPLAFFTVRSLSALNLDVRFSSPGVNSHHWEWEWGKQPQSSMATTCNVNHKNISSGGIQLEAAQLTWQDIFRTRTDDYSSAPVASMFGCDKQNSMILIGFLIELVEGLPPPFSTFLWKCILLYRNLPDSISQMLGLQVCTRVLRLNFPVRSY